VPRIEILLRGLKRRADAAAISARYQDPEYQATREAELRRRASHEGNDDEVPPMGNMEKVGGVWQPKRAK